MEIAYWIIAGLLALFFLYAGGIKAVRTAKQLKPMMGWVDTVPLPFVRVIGVLEVLGAVGLILPPLTGVAPALALVAMIGLLIIQLGAVALHLRRGEAKLIGLNVGLLVAGGVTVALAPVWL